MLARIRNMRRALTDLGIKRMANLSHVEMVITDRATALRLGHPKIIANDLWPDCLP